MASLADMRVVRTIETRATTSGVAETTSQLKDMAAAHSQVERAAASSATVTETSARRSGTLAGAYERERRALDPLVAAREKYDRTMRNLDRAHSAGISSLSEHTRLIDLARERHERLIGVNDNLAKSHQLAAHQVGNLRAQLFDVATTLQGGMSPLSILMQQGPQIAQIFGPGQGGVLGILRGIGQAIPRSFAIGGGALAIGASFATAYSQSQREGIEEARGLRGVGMRSGLNRQELEKLYSGPGGLGVGDLSISESRSAALSMAGAGLGAESITRGLANARTMSVALNLSLDDTTKLLTDFGRDPVKSYDALAKATGYANSGTRQYIASLAEQGEVDKALITTLDAIAGRLGSYRDNTTAVDRALTKMGNVGSNMWSLFKRDVDAATDASGKHAEAVKSTSEIATEALERERKKVEERNAAYRERSDALVASMVIDNRIAGMDPLRQSIVTAQRSVGAGPALSSAEVEARKSEGETQRALRESLERRIEEQTVLRNTIELRKSLTEQTRVSTLSMTAELDAIGKSVAEQSRLSFVAQARIAAGQGGKRISEETEKQILKEADAYSKLADNLQRARVEDQIKFDRSQLGRSTQDQAIASQLRPFGGMDAPGNAGMVRQLRELDEARKLRTETVQALDEMRSGGRGLITGGLGDLARGRDPRQNLINSMWSMNDKIIDRFISKPTMEGLLGRDGELGGGLIGKLVGTGIGGMTQTANMTVTAANVVISGGLTGLSGGVPGLSGPTTPGESPSGVLAAPIAASRTLVQDGTGRVLSMSTGSPGGLPITVRPTGVGDGAAGELLPYRTPSATAPSSDAWPSGPLPAWTARPTWFRETPSDPSSYLPDSSRAAWGPLYRGMTDMGANRQSELAGASDQAAESLRGLSGSGNDAVNALNSIARGVGGSGGVNIGGMFGIGSAQASPGASTPMASGGDFFADGGIMSSRGRLPLSFYSAGGIADSPQMAVFGEGRLPEAYVPLPDGRSIPVTMKDARPAAMPASGSSSFSYTEAPMNIQSAAGVTPERWMAARAQDRASALDHLRRNFGAIAADHARRYG